MTTETYTLSLHDALPIFHRLRVLARRQVLTPPPRHRSLDSRRAGLRPEEHTSELQSRENLVCRLLLEKQKKKPIRPVPQGTVIRCKSTGAAYRTVRIRHT